MSQKRGDLVKCEVFSQLEPSTLEYRRLLATPPPDGQEAVMGAMRYFNHYSAQIGAKEDWGKVPKSTAGSSFKVPSLPLTMAEIRSGMANY